jgi:hypothetical protein
MRISTRPILFPRRLVLDKILEQLSTRLVLKTLLAPDRLLLLDRLLLETLVPDKLQPERSGRELQLRRLRRFRRRGLRMRGQRA